MLLAASVTRFLSQAGAAMNATWTYISETQSIFGTIFGLLLLTVTTQVSRASEASKHGDVLKLIKMAIVSSIALGMVGEIIMLVTVTSIETLFEGNDKLLPNADELMYAQASAFVLTVVLSAGFAVMFGRNELVFLALSLMPAVFIFVAAAVTFKQSENLAIFVGANILIAVQLCIFIVYRIRQICQSLAKEKDVPGSPGLFSLGELSVKDDWIPFVKRGANVLMRTLTLGFKTFLSMLFATRLNNVTGSLMNVLQTLSGPLFGLSAFLGLGSVTFLAKVLERRDVAGFRKTLRMACCAYYGAAALFVLFSIVTGTSFVLKYADQHEDPDYVDVYSALNHFFWYAGVVAQSMGNFYDGFLLCFLDWTFIGYLYSLDFLLVFLPILLGTQYSSLPISGLGTPVEGVDKFGGILLANLVHGIVRCIAAAWRVHGHHMITGLFADDVRPSRGSSFETLARSALPKSPRDDDDQAHQELASMNDHL